jgi:hypothetical protein
MVDTTGALGARTVDVVVPDVVPDVVVAAAVLESVGAGAAVSLGVGDGEGDALLAVGLGDGETSDVTVDVSVDTGSGSVVVVSVGDGDGNTSVGDEVPVVDSVPSPEVAMATPPTAPVVPAASTSTSVARRTSCRVLMSSAPIGR